MIKDYLKMKYTRHDYMTGICTHRQYHAQYVTDTIKKRVANMIEYWVKHNGPITCPHLNDIPLNKWDKLSRGLFPFEMAQSTCVCVLKEAAKQILEGENNANI